MSSRRDIGPFLRRLRDIFLSRKNVNTLRWKPDMSARTQPPPNLPQGPHSKLSGNYYYTRDPRREIKPPLLIANAEEPKAVTAGDGTENVLRRTPGPTYKWDA